MASSSKPKRIYHVFLSFRGTDVREKFLRRLYTALDLKGIYTYIDSEELKKGEQIEPTLMKAIEESHIAVIVFSEDYASSSWCLSELAKIMDDKEERDLKVLPVFYKVEPREVRTPRGKYKEAMVKHESKFGKNAEKVKRWKEALVNASNLSGWHLKDGDDLEHIQKIVNEITDQLGRTPLRVAKHPVGIDSRVDKLKSMLNLESNDGVLMVGLWGQGGIGKTTLAKAIYNDISRQFEGSCFLANVREASKDCKDLVSLQEKLLSEILLRKERLVVSNADAGTNLVQERLCHKKVLLILDDVDDKCQINALAGEGKWFGNGSRIIFTTRDKHLLTAHEIDQDHVYEVKALNVSEACELLSTHAFSTHQNIKIRRDLVDGVLNYAKGLPLALELLGSFLCGRREEAWKSTLKKLSRIPNRSVNDVLKISFDGLEEDEKEIFLHIACFFKGQKIEYIKKILDSCDFETTIGLEILIERSLITSDSITLQMHDLIQLMGMDIVKQECRDDAGRRSRLWLYDDVLNVLSYDKGDCLVKAIVLEPIEPKEIIINVDAFIKMRRLKLLILHNVHNSFQGPVYLPNWLRWFEWPGAPRILEFSSGPKQLVGLDMSKSNITIVPKQFKDFQNLKFINFNECESLASMPDLSCTPNLEELNLQNCKNLVEAHKSIAYHDKLQIIALYGCSQLSVFPNVLLSKKLRTLDLENCTKLERFPDIPQKLALEELALRGTAIKELPTSIENLVALKRIDVRDCKNLVSLPSSIYKLQNIEDLSLKGCTGFIKFPKYEDSADPKMKTGLSNLRDLDFEGCNLSEVEFLENLSCFPLLNHLILSGNKITSLPTSINKRDSLTGLSVPYCHQLREIPKLPPFLNFFSAINCESLQNFGEFTSSPDFIRRALTMDRVFSRNKHPFDLKVFHPGLELPQWVIPIGEDFVSFVASKDLCDKFIGFALCVVIGNDEEKYVSTIMNGEAGKFGNIKVDARVNGKRLPVNGQRFRLLDSDHLWFNYIIPSEQWGIVDFGQIEGSYIQFHFGVWCTTMRKWGFRILCKRLEDDLESVLQDNQSFNLAFLYDVSHGSINSEAEMSLVQTETNLQRGLEDYQVSTKEHDQIVQNRNHNHILTEGTRTKTMLRRMLVLGNFFLFLMICFFLLTPSQVPYSRAPIPRGRIPT